MSIRSSKRSIQIPKRRIGIKKRNYCAIPIIFDSAKIAGYQKFFGDLNCSDKRFNSELIASLEDSFNSFNKTLSLADGNIGIINQDVSKEVQRRLAEDFLQNGGSSLLEVRLWNIALEYMDNPSQDTLELTSENISDDSFSQLVELDMGFRETVKDVLENRYKPRNKPIWINVTNFCAGDVICIGAIRAFMSRWIQDTFYGTSFEKKEPTKVSVVNAKIEFEDAPTQTATKILSCNCGRLKDRAIAFVDMPGGNIQVADKFVLIGMDELQYRYLSTKCPVVRKRLFSMKIDTTLRGVALAKAVQVKLEANLSLSKKKVIWYGTENRQERFYKDYQNTKCYFPDKLTYGFSPYYHLDMGLMMLGPDPENPKKYLFLVGNASTDYQDVPRGQTKIYKDVVDQLNEFTKESFSNFEADFKEVMGKGYSVDSIHVPTSIVLENLGADGIRLKKIFSFTNGLVENTSKGIKYYIPDYRSAISDEDGITKHSKAIKEVRKKLRKLGVKTRRVHLEDYGIDDGLHCNVKIFSREISK